MLMESVVQIIKSFNIDSARPASLFGELISSRLKTRHGALHSLCILCSLHIHNSMTDFINAIAIIHKLFFGNVAYILCIVTSGYGFFRLSRGALWWRAKSACYSSKVKLINRCISWHASQTCSFDYYK